LFTRAAVGAAAAVLLAPLAVDPEWQKRGVGTVLSRAGLATAHAMGFGLALVLGHPEYYPHFGFEPAMPYGIEPPYPVEPAEAWMVAELTPGALDAASGPVGMSEVFLDPAMWRE
jgi:putative acetyltransferase